MRNDMSSSIYNNKNMDIWDKNWSANTELDLHPEIIALVKKYSKGKEILEVGFGTGGDLLFLDKLGFNCSGIEKSIIAYKRALKLKGLNIVFGDAKKMPYKSGQFDVVFHQGVLEHFRDPDKILLENRRVLKKGGVIIIDVPHKWNCFTIYKKAHQILGNWYGGWERSFSASELKSLINKNKFKTLRVQYRGVFPHQWYKFLYPEKIINNRRSKDFLLRSPFKYIQRFVKYVYKKNKFIQLVSSYNVIIVARKI